MIRFLLLGVGTVAAALCGSPAHSDDTIKIGLIEPYSGQFADPTAQADDGVKLYLKRHGEKLGGRNVEIIRKDVGGIKPPVAKRLAQELVTRDDVDILAGFSLTPNALAVADMSAEAGVAAVLAMSLFFGGAQAGQEGTDMRLEDMGFTMRAANTPEQLARLRLLPPRKFLTRNKNGQRYYIYADPDYCQCVFLGNELAMKNYNNLISPPPQAPMVIGSGDLPPTVAQQMIDEVDPGLAIVDGDILDY